MAQYGEMQFIGAKMAIEQINKAGGVNGAQLEGVVYDLSLIHISMCIRDSPFPTAFAHSTATR